MTNRRLLPIFLFVFALLCRTADAAPLGKVVRILDGTTVVVDFAGTQLPVRLAGIEIPQGTEASGRSYESIARQYLDAELLSRFVLLEYDPRLPRTDRDGRTVAQLYRSPDALFVTGAMIRAGIAVVSRQERCAFTPALLDAQRHARGAGAGYWNETGVASTLFDNSPNVKYLGTFNPEEVAAAQRSGRKVALPSAPKTPAAAKPRAKSTQPQQPIVVIVREE
jgi:endonuclease YncB( thermonuclease family)